MSEQKKQWSLSIGTYPGILFGMRSYEEEGQTTHVFYLPLIDIALEVYNYWDYLIKEFRIYLLSTRSITQKVG